MQELEKGLNEVAAGPLEGEEDKFLREMAKKWAAHCLETYTDMLLRRGLDISEALSNMAAEWEKGKGGE